MLPSKALMGLAGGASETLYVDDVFSAYTYTGNGSTQTITNGIDLAGKGGMVWTKSRGQTSPGYIGDTVRGGRYQLASNGTGTPGDYGSTAISAFAGTGYTLGNDVSFNYSGYTYVGWTFRKAPKFFDVVTYTGTGANRTVAHNLGFVPGMIITKRTDTTGNWITYHRSLGNTDFVNLNTTAITTADSGAWNNTSPTSTDFSLGTGNTNVSGGTYVAYLFAHDTSADGLIQCGSFTTDGSGNATVNLGWEPQFMITKSSSQAEGWYMNDTARGFLASPTGAVSGILANSSAVESGTRRQHITATGFTVEGGLSASQTYIYLAIRRPNKPPTTGTQVYNAIARTGTGAAATVTGVGFGPDLAVSYDRDAFAAAGATFFDRLRGANLALKPSSTAAESTKANSLVEFGVDGVKLGSDANSVINGGTPYINWFFRRAPGVFDVVCYTGTGSATTINHSLGAIPELIIVKVRNSSSYGWVTYVQPVGATHALALNTTAVPFSDSTAWNSTVPTANVFSVGTSAASNGASSTYVAYLFATKPGISKVGSYTGNGSSQTIDCGFTTGARFVLIKRLDASGSWRVFDSTRGINPGTDPFLLLESYVSSEDNTLDAVDTNSSGFIVNNAASINVNGSPYIYLAFA